MATIQDEVFFEREGDRWYQRNREALDCGGDDWPLRMVSMLGDLSEVHAVAELGCCNGYRLNELRSRIPWASRWAGVDASAEAIAEGASRYEGLELVQGLLSAIPLEGEFDLVVVNFVLHWIDRRTHVRSLAEIDRLVADGGWLVLGDFAPDYPQRRAYHHLPEAEVYTYKQDYASVFEALGTYRQVARVTYDHDDRSAPIVPVGGDKRAFCSALRKSLQDYHPVVGP